MTDVCYRTGQLARALGVSSYQIRRLAETGLIEAEYSGKQWRIPARELVPLQRDGVPEIPANTGEAQSPLPRPKSPSGHPALFAEPSEQVIEAAEEVVVLENEVKALGLRRQKEEVLDWFRGRERDEAEQLAAQEQAELDRKEAERRRQAREDAEREREEWLESWERYALGCLPSDAPPEVKLELHQAVRERLQRLQPIPESDVTYKLVDALTAKALAPWRKRKEVERVIEDAVNRLPSGARSYFKPTAWQIKATQGARQAIRQVDQDASLPEIEAAARRAVEVTAAEFEALQAAAADAEMRESITRWAPMPSGQSDSAKEAATKGIREALAALPVSIPRQSRGL